MVSKGKASATGYDIYHQHAITRTIDSATGIRLTSTIGTLQAHVPSIVQCSYWMPHRAFCNSNAPKKLDTIFTGTSECIIFVFYLFIFTMDHFFFISTNIVYWKKSLKIPAERHVLLKVWRGRTVELIVLPFFSPTSNVE